MTDLLHSWPVDDLGPETVCFLRLPMGAEAVVVVDNLTLGTAMGGVRLAPSVTAAEVARLARAMTIKNAVAGLPYGGGKAGIHTAGPLSMDDKERTVRAFAQGIRDLRCYIPGPDMGTDETAMAWIRDEIGRAVGLPSVIGGIPLDEIGATGYGLAECASALELAGRLALEGARVAVQGFGAVGRHAALQLEARGARVVCASDSTGAVYNPDGLNLPELVEFARVGHIADYDGAKPIPRDDLITVDCDVLVPAARPDVLDESNAHLIRASVVLAGANLPVTPAAEAVLAKRGILSVPDVIANAGGVICAALEYHGGRRAQAFAEISDRIRASTAEWLDRLSGQQDLLPSEVAVMMARSRLKAGSTFRRRY